MELFGKIGKALDKGINEAKKAVEKTTEQAQELLEKTKEKTGSLKEFAEDLTNKTKESLEKLDTEVKDLGKKFDENPGETLKNLASTATKKTVEITKKGMKKGEELIDSYLDEHDEDSKTEEEE